MISLLIYRILLIILLPLVFVALFIRSKNNTAYRQRLLERMGFFPKPYKTGGIVVHAASVGEVIALKSVIEKLLNSYPNIPITVTSFTPTGSAQIQKLFGDSVQHGYLPLDIYPFSALFLRQLKPKMMIFMETELWPNLIAQCEQRDIKLLLINGRLSHNSLKSYRKIAALIKPCLNRFDKILCQSEENLSHFIQLGADTSRTINSGNLKFDISVNDEMMAKKSELSHLLGTDDIHTKRPVWLVASTHTGDENIALTAFKTIQQRYPNLLLILVPRHPERFEQVAKLCIEQKFTVARRSEAKIITDEQVWLLDSLGELMPTFDLSDIVTMGGSFSDVGGHNPLEPALFSKPIIVGHNMSNFNEVMQQLRQEKAIIELPEQNASLKLAEQVCQLLKQPEQQALIGQNAFKVVMANQGASDITLAQVKSLLPENITHTKRKEARGDNA